MNNSFEYAEYWLEKVSNHINNEKYKIILAPPTIMIDHIDEILMNSELERLENASKNVRELDEKELEELMSEIRDLSISGQDCHYQEKGAFTGDVSAKMLSEAGCEYVIIGHSERRKYHFEQDKIILEKVKSSLKENLIPILCVGENLQVRNNVAHIEFIRSQLENNIPKDLEIKDLIIAYEPIWSIGTGKLPSKDELISTTAYIKSVLAGIFKKNIPPVLYGGSIDESSIKIFKDIRILDGFLIGGASKSSKKFIDIIKNYYR